MLKKLSNKNFKKLIENLKSKKNLKLNKNSLKLSSKPNIINIINIIKKLNYLLLIASFIAIIYISLIIYYLNNLVKCDCYNKLNEKNYSNIQFLIIIESIILTLFILVFISSLYNFFLFKNGGMTSVVNVKSLLITLIISILAFVINIYIIYTIYKISQNIKDNCECSKSWIRYLLYIQGFIILINTIIIFIRLLTFPYMKIK
jgi:hypothetical protein